MKQKSIDDFWPKTAGCESSGKQWSTENFLPRARDTCSFRSFQRNIGYLPRLHEELVHRSLHRSKKTVCDKDISFQQLNSFPIYGFCFDSRAEYSLMHQEKEMILYSVDNDLCKDNTSHMKTAGILKLSIPNMAQISVNWRGFISSVLFNGASLNVSCAVKPDPLVFIFDLETVDEENVVPLIVFDLKYLRSNANNTSASVHAIAPFSDLVNVAGLNDGKTVYLDTRVGKAILCIEYNPFSLYTLGRPIKRPTSITSLSVNWSDPSQLICGTQCGSLFLWDLRHTQHPLTNISTGSFEISKIICLPHSSDRIGCSRIVCSNSGGSCYEYGVGNAFMKFWEWSSGNISRFISERPSPKIDLHESVPLALFPDAQPNSILLFDVSSSPRIGDRRQTLGDRQMKREPQLVSSLGLPYESVTTVNWMPNKEKILLGLSGGRVYVMDLGPDRMG